MLGRLRVRRGDPDPDTPLDRAWDLALQTGDLQRLWPVAAARAEGAWLAGRPSVAPLVAESSPWRNGSDTTWAVGEFGYWLWRRAGGEPPPLAAAPYAAQMAGEPGPRPRGDELGCPYEAAIALARPTTPSRPARAPPSSTGWARGRPPRC